MTWRWFPQPDSSDPTLVALLEIDGHETLFALHIHDGFAVWMLETGQVLLVMQLWAV
jgi:hypothetical protein